jgi:hypothetical protein
MCCPQAKQEGYKALMQSILPKLKQLDADYI